MAVEHGFIVLGDVSGYGEFIAKTELDHSREILAELLSTLCECAPGRLSIAQLEGDAVFWLCGEDAPELDRCHDLSLPSVRLCRCADAQVRGA